MPSPSPPDWDDIFFGAALDPDRWLDALRDMADHTGSAHGQLIGVGGPRELVFNLVNDFDPSDFDQFEAVGGASPEVNYRIAVGLEDIARGSYDRILYEPHYDAALPALHTSDYIAWCADVDIPFGCQTNLVVDRGGLIGFALLRRQSEGPTTAQQRRVFAVAAAAARRAVRLQERLEGEQARLLAGAFDAIRVAAFILDGSGRVQAMSEAAEQIVASGTVALHGRSLDAEATPLSLGRATAALVADGGLDHLQLRIDPPGRQPVFMEGFRLPRRPWSLGRLPHAILLVKAPQRDRAGIAAFLGALYRFTTAEADIAMRLFDGQSRAEIAERRQVTTETLRGQIKTICAKTDARGERDLLRTLAAIMT